MDITDIIKYKFEKLKEILFNKRAGICPYGFESLNPDILRILAETKISATYVHDEMGRIHGHNVFVNLDEFLDSIDIYLSCGKDNHFYGVLHKKRTQSLKVDMLDILDAEDNRSVIAPLREKYTYIKLFRLKDDEEILLKNSGYSREYLKLISEDNCKREKEYLTRMNFDPKLIRRQREIPFFLQSMLCTGYVFSPCPSCGKVCKTDQSFCMFTNSYHQLIFYRFCCCKIFYLLIGDSQQRKIGMYMPEDELMVNFIFYNDCPSCEAPYNKEYYEKWINDFKKHILFCWNNREHYVSQTKKKRNVCLIGFVSNLGHHLADELSAVQKLYDTGDINKINTFLIGSHDYFTIGDIFPKLPISGTASQNSIFLFKILLENNCFTFRLCHRGPIQEELAKKIYHTSATKCTTSFFQEVDESRRHWPLVWITLRSHNRIWLSQKDGLANIINLLYKNFPALGIIFDGMPAERQLMEDIRRLLTQGIATYDALDCKIHETVVWAHAIDFYIAPYGNGTNFTSLANKTGIVHTHSTWMRNEPFCMNRRENCELAIPVRVKYDSGDDAFTSNYEIEWKDIYDAAIEITRKLKTGKTRTG